MYLNPGTCQFYSYRCPPEQLPPVARTDCTWSFGRLLASFMLLELPMLPAPLVLPVVEPVDPVLLDPVVEPVDDPVVEPVPVEPAEPIELPLEEPIEP